MNSGIVTSLISNGTTILVGILTAVVAYQASIKGAKVQIENEKANLQNEKNEQKIFAQSVIERFILHELKKNFITLDSDFFRKNLPMNQTPFQYGFRINAFNFTEFDRVKYEIIKYDSPLVKEIIEIYDVFYLLDRKGDLGQLTQREYDQFKKVFDICLVKYSD